MNYVLKLEYSLPANYFSNISIYEIYSTTKKCVQ